MDGIAATPEKRKAPTERGLAIQQPGVAGGLVGISTEQRLQLRRGIGLQTIEPAAIRIAVDLLGRIDKLLVDGGDDAGDRRIDVRGGFHRFHHTYLLTGLELLADLRKLDI